MSGPFLLCFPIIVGFCSVSALDIQGSSSQVSPESPPAAISPSSPSLDLHLANLRKAIWRPSYGGNIQGAAIPTNYCRREFYTLKNASQPGQSNEPQIIHNMIVTGEQITMALFPPSSGNHSSSNSFSYKSLHGRHSILDPAEKNCDPSEQGDLSRLGTFPTTNIDPAVLETYQGATKHIKNVSCKISAYIDSFNDPLWPKQWYIHDYRTVYGPVMDHNVVPVYRMGYTGDGVKISLVDSGVIKHPDLIPNYLTEVSYDYQRMSSDAEPTVLDHDHMHGSYVASVIAMAANNSICGVGMAFNAKFASVKPSGSHSSLPLREAQALAHGLTMFQIIHNSRGPLDDGKYANPLNRFVLSALEMGMRLGRNGLGMIYPFPSGNGKHNNDHCSLDCVVNHHYTIAISAVTQSGKSPYYSEGCSAVFAAAYSGGDKDEERLVTADLDGKCAKRFTGTSASLPFATSIFALMLEANPHLSVRDVMHIITMGAEVAPVADNPDSWYKNGAGFWVSNEFGFGLLNAENMVNLALQWQSVAEESYCKASASTSQTDQLTVSSPVLLKIEADCGATVNWIEQVELVVSVAYPFRGALTIDITSPAGTNTRLMDKRINDSNPGGLSKWVVKSTHNWGEYATGTWAVLVIANRIAGIPAGNGKVMELDLVIHGLTNPPPHQNWLPRKYAPFRTTYGQTSD